MARARLLKPGFFTNASLSEIPPYGRLLFAGLWTIADKEGRLKDEPRWIKGALFPYEAVPVERLLVQLAERDFIRRYEVDGHKFIQITSFLRHQSPHMKEADSIIPPPFPIDHSHGASPVKFGTSTSLAPDEHGAASKKGKTNLNDGAEHQASTIPAPDEHSASAGNSGTSPSVPISDPDPDPVPVPVPSDPVDRACAAFAKFGRVTSGTPQAVEYAIKDYGLDWVNRAIRDATGAGFDDKPPWSYVESILERWKKQGAPDEPRPRLQGANRVASNSHKPTASERARARFSP